MTVTNDHLITTDIVLICIDSVLKKTKKKCTFSELIKECFKSYPSLFALTDIPKWPDSLKLDRPLRTLRERGYINGSPVTYYTITNFGYKILNNLKQRSHSNSASLKLKPTRSPDLLILQQVNKSEDFLRYKHEKNKFVPNNMRIREQIKFTLETPNRTVVNYLKHLKTSAQKNKFNDLVNYFDLYVKFLSIKKL